MNDHKTVKVDAHQHFWRYIADQFGWIDDAMAGIRKDFVPEDLKPQLDAAGVDRTIAVQARQTLQETDWLLQLAAENDWIAGVVGWLPLADPNFAALLEEYSVQAKLCGVRHVLQAEPDDFFDRTDFHHGLGRLREYGLVYDLLIIERQLEATIRFVDRHPNQVFVLDHVAKPAILSWELEPWRSGMRALAERPHVVCKLSGMVTEADYQRWSIDDLRPYAETALDAFGAQRILFGSDWPVCTVSASYGRWFDTANALLSGLSVEERNAIFGTNALRIYNVAK